MALVIAASTPLLTRGVGNNTALGFLVYYGGYAMVSILSGGGSLFPDQHLGLVNVAIAGLNTGVFALAASLVRLPVRTKPLRARWLVAGLLAIVYLALLLVFIPSPWWI